MAQLIVEVCNQVSNFIERTHSIIISKSVLLQEIVLVKFGDLQANLISLSQGRFTDQLHDFSQILLILENLRHLTSV